MSTATKTGVVADGTLRAEWIAPLDSVVAHDVSETAQNGNSGVDSNNSTNSHS